VKDLITSRVLLPSQPDMLKMEAGCIVYDRCLKSGPMENLLI